MRQMKLLILVLFIGLVSCESRSSRLAEKSTATSVKKEKVVIIESIGWTQSEIYRSDRYKVKRLSTNTVEFIVLVNQPALFEKNDTILY